MNTEGKNKKETALRDHIAEVALNAFFRQGIRAVTMDEIASLLGMSKRTLYELFPDKESLVIACMQAHHEKHSVELVRLLSEKTNVIDIILSFYRYTVEVFYKINPRFFQDTRRYPSVQKKIKEDKKHSVNDTIAFYKRGVEEGLLRNDVNFEIAHELLDHQFTLLMHSDLSEKYSFLDVYELIFLTFLRGVSTEKGLLIIEEFVTEHPKKNRE